MVIFVYEKIDQKSGNRQYPVLVLTKIWRLRGVKGIKFYWMLQNNRVLAFNVSELSRENQQGGWEVKLTPTQIRVNKWSILSWTTNTESEGIISALKDVKTY